MMRAKSAAVFGLAVVMACLASQASAQDHKPLPPAEAASADQAPETPHRTRLILKDGSYQVVMSNYTVKGKVVHFMSAERGDMEEIPTDLIDWDATHKWEKRHPANGENPAPEIDPELLKEEADRAAWTPEVAPDLHLPEEDSVLALDYFQGTPELVPLVQSDGDLNRTTSHNILRQALNPRAAQHAILTLKGEESPVQMHVAQPEIYIRIGDDSGVSHGGTPFVVDTHGAGAGEKSADSGGSANSGYVMVRADIRTDARVLASFNINALGTSKQEEDVVDTKTEMLPGGHWMKVTPVRPLDFGEYALMEVVSNNAVNLGVWDFGVHPVKPENRDVIKPQPKRPIELERRGPGM